MKRYYYHATRNTGNWGRFKVLYPASDGSNRGDSEPITPRICVSPTIIQTLIAIPLDFTNYHIYRTESKIDDRHVKHPGEGMEIDDYWITGETWIMKPCKFVKLGIIRRDITNRLTASQNHTCITLGDGEIDSELWQIAMLSELMDHEKNLFRG